MICGAEHKGTHEQIMSLVDKKNQNPNANPNNNGEGSHRGLLLYDNYQWTCALDETSTPIVKQNLKASSPLFYIYLYFKILNRLLKCTQ